MAGRQSRRAGREGVGEGRMQALPLRSLGSRTFIGLLLAQFTATFNDQAIHMVAIFFASDMLVRYMGLQSIDEKLVLAIVTACFIIPFLVFSPLAGVLADRYSKRNIVVFWKVAEVLIMTLALVGLFLPQLIARSWGDPQILAITAAVMVVASVFLMGLHSTFFVPAKYGIMPELLHPSILSRGNGLLEGTSFMAQIFGTAAGGLLYATFKSTIHRGQLEAGHEWFIGLLLLGFAALGTLTAYVMEQVPAAAPDRKIDYRWWPPLRENLSLLKGSRPLTLAVTGIAFAAFMTLFVRQVLLYDAEQKKELHVVTTAHEAATTGRKAANPDLTASGNATAKVDPAAPGNLAVDAPAADPNAGPVPAANATIKAAPVVAQNEVGKSKKISLKARLKAATQESETRVSLLIALIGFGVGLGSLCAGYLSGERVELGLVPVGGLLLVALFAVLATIMSIASTVTILLFLIGLSAGLYIVPLYTLLQHRAPKELKGNVIAASNFVNVIGGIGAVLLFYLLTWGAERMLGITLSPHEVHERPELIEEYHRQIAAGRRIPQLLFMFTALMVIATSIRLSVLQPDFLLRLNEFLRGLVRGRAHVEGLDRIPSRGPALLLTDVDDERGAMRLAGASDRNVRIMILPATESTGTTRVPLMLQLAGVSRLNPGTTDREPWSAAQEKAHTILSRGDLLAVSCPQHSAPRAAEEWVQSLIEYAIQKKIPLLTAICRHAEDESLHGRPRRPDSRDTVSFGSELSTDRLSLAEVRQQIEQLKHVSRQAGEQAHAAKTHERTEPAASHPGH